MRTEIYTKQTEIFAFFSINLFFPNIFLPKRKKKFMRKFILQEIKITLDVLDAIILHAHKCFSPS